MMADDRLFMITKSYLEKEMKRGTELSGVKKIRLHDLRHPNVKHRTKVFNPTIKISSKTADTFRSAVLDKVL